MCTDSCRPRPGTDGEARFNVFVPGIGGLRPSVGTPKGPKNRRKGCQYCLALGMKDWAEDVV